jgi:hypothetical protein
VARFTVAEFTSGCRTQGRYHHASYPAFNQLKVDTFKLSGLAQDTLPFNQRRNQQRVLSNVTNTKWKGPIRFLPGLPGCALLPQRSLRKTSPTHQRMLRGLDVTSRNPLLVASFHNSSGTLQRRKQGALRPAGKRHRQTNLTSS